VSRKFHADKVLASFHPLENAVILARDIATIAAHWSFVIEVDKAMIADALGDLNNVTLRQAG
jgi:hypothetical protein